ncbi:MAG: hypothetical protein Q4A79_03130, partial [Candidatus Saccharibacteria bacterium]|nr:hypothetical protein [Candidatus Saccharibacteria bacterium]
MNRAEARLEGFPEEPFPTLLWEEHPKEPTCVALLNATQAPRPPDFLVDPFPDTIPVASLGTRVTRRDYPIRRVDAAERFARIQGEPPDVFEITYRV